MNEDLYPNDGTYFGVPLEPQDQVVARKKEKAATLESKKEIEKAVERLSARVEATDSVRQALIVAKKYGCTTAEALIALDITRQQLEEEKYLLEELLEVHSKR